MADSLMTVGSTPYQTLVLLDAGGDPADEVMSYFGDTCDCSAPEWVKQQIINANATTIAAIKVMIAPDAFVAPSAPRTNPVSTMLTSTKCVGKDLYGVYLSPAGTSSDQLIATNSASCQ